METLATIKDILQIITLILAIILLIKMNIKK